MRRSTIQQSLQSIVDNPEMETDDILSLPASELVCRTLFELANSPKVGDRNALSRANMARRMIFDRMVGKRKPGSHPATRTQIAVKFNSLTGEK